MSKLYHIEPFIDPAVKELTANSLDQISSILIALRRIRKNWMKWFEDFLSFLKKIEAQAPDFYIYQVYLKYLSHKINKNPYQALITFLEEKGYNESELSSILLQKEYDEGAFLNRLPKTNAWFLWTCVFYLYEPRLTYNFFFNNLTYTILDDEKDLLSIFRKLKPDHQKSLLTYMRQMELHQDLERKATKF